MFDNYIVVYKYLGDLIFYVTGSQDENELILYSVLTAFFESISILLRYLPAVGSLTWCKDTIHSRFMLMLNYAHAGSRLKKRLRWRTWTLSS